jgi:predicted transcriptional regulator
MIKKAYIVFMHNYAPIPNQKGEWAVLEQILFVDKVNKTMEKSATVIIDFIKEKIDKSRYEDKTYQDLIDHVANKYTENYVELLRLVGRDIPEELQAKLEKDLVVAEDQNPENYTAITL